MSIDQIIQKKKLLYRLRYRGIKELDLIFQKYTERYFDKICKSDIDELIEISKIPDLELLDFIMDKKEVPSNLKNKTFLRLKSFS
tara:strand:+ start:939 stop:1193 length:255 start_codon:yes stop_codon:yes gene_type:complete